MWETDGIRSEERAGVLYIRAECAPPEGCTGVVRAYAEGLYADLLLGVLMPEDGRLTLSRRLTPEDVRAAGCGALIGRYYLSDSGPRVREKAEMQSAVQRGESDDGAGQPAAGTAQEEAEVQRRLPREQVCPRRYRRSVAASHARKDAVPLPGQAGSCAGPVEPRREAARPAALPQGGGSPLAAKRSPEATGDPLLDRAVRQGGAVCSPKAGGWRVSCPFGAGMPFALAFAAAVCRVEGDTAVLDYPPQPER